MAASSFLPFTRPTIDEATIAAVGDVLRSGWITSGPKVREFEAQLSALFNGRPVRALSSATGGMEIALSLAGVAPGDEVITTPMSWVATANVILRAGARPVFVDCDPRTRNIDLELIEAAITPRTRAILPVDLAGLPVDRDRLYAIAKVHRLRVIEDAAQSMGANWAGRLIGASGDLVSISFHANKNVTTAEGGCLVLNDEDEARRCELWRLQGCVRRGDSWDGMDVTLAGGKHNLTDLAACIVTEYRARLGIRRAIESHFADRPIAERLISASVLEKVVGTRRSSVLTSGILFSLAVLAVDGLALPAAFGIFWSSRTRTGFWWRAGGCVYYAALAFSVVVLLIASLEADRAEAKGLREAQRIIEASA